MTDNQRLIIYLHDAVDRDLPILQFGMKLAKDTNRAIVLNKAIQQADNLTAAPGASSGVHLPAEELKIERQKQEDRLQAICDQVEQQGIGCSYSTYIGSTPESLARVVEKSLKDIILIERHHEANLFTELFGTFETRLTEKVHPPVLIVPYRHTYETPQQIIWLDESSAIDETELANLRSFFKALDAELHIYLAQQKVWPSDDPRLKKLYTLAERYRIVREHIQQIAANQLPDLLEKIDQNESITWLAVHRQSKNAANRLIDDYNTNRMALEANMPVLLF